MFDAAALDITSDSIRLSDTRQCYGSEQALPCVDIQTERLRAVVAFQGAQLLSFCPAGEADWLWLSPKARFEAGRAIRGGIPLCLPWFGSHPEDPGLPKHGFLRNRPWQLAGANELAEQVLRLRFAISSSDEDAALFPWPFWAELDMYLADHIVLALRVRNDGDRPMPLSFAFHSYFAVPSLSQVRIEGLRGHPFLDNTEALAVKQQRDELQFDGEIDRVYQGLGGSQALYTPERKLLVSGKRCDTAIVWNPGQALATTMDDVGEYYRDYVCLERGAAFADRLSLAPGQQHQAVMVVSRRASDGIAPA